MNRVIRRVCLLLALCGGAAVGRAEPTKEERLKAVRGACAVIEKGDGVKPGEGLRWSAVAVGRGGYFVSATTYENGHVVGTKVWVTLRPGEKDEKVLVGEVVRADDRSRLVLVRAEGAGDLPAVVTGDDSKVAERDGLTALGVAAFDFDTLPIGDDGKRKLPPKALAEVKVAVALRVQDADKKLTRFTLGKPGVTGQLVVGGPAVNGDGEVVGLVGPDEPGTFGPLATGRVIPLARVNQFLADAPVVDLAPPEVEPKAKHDPVVVTAGLVAGFGKPDGYTLELRVGSDRRERVVAMRPAGDGFEARVAPFEKADTPAPVTVEVGFPDSRPRVPVADAAFKVGGKEYRLSEVTRVRFGTGGGVSTLRGTADGQVTGLDELAVRTGGQTFALKTAAATDLVVRLPAEPEDCYRLTVVAKRDGKEVGRAEAVRFLTGTAPAGIDGLRMGHLVKPKAGDTPRTFARVLVGGEDQPRVFTAEQLGAVGSNGLTGAGPALGAVKVSLYPVGVKPRPLFPTPEQLEASVPSLVVDLYSSTTAQLTAGDYPDATWTPATTWPGLNVTGDDVPPAGARRGHFVVHEVEMKPGTVEVKALAADFVFYPHKRGRPLVGVIRINSKFD